MTTITNRTSTLVNSIWSLMLQTIGSMLNHYEMQENHSIRSKLGFLCKRAFKSLNTIYCSFSFHSDNFNVQMFYSYYYKKEPLPSSTPISQSLTRPPSYESCASSPPVGSTKEDSTQLSWNSQYRPAWPQTHRDPSACANMPRQNEYFR